MGYKHVMCVFQKCPEKIISAKMCVEIETYTVFYMHEMCVFRKFPEKVLSSKICALKFSWKFLCCFYFFKDSA